MLAKPLLNALANRRAPIIVFPAEQNEKKKYRTIYIDPLESH